jgi:hypothetical protein
VGSIEAARVTSLVPAPDAQPAEWIADALRDFAKSVLSLVPGGFDAYVRVFHPARMRSGEPVTWADIADANARQAHPGMQLNALTGIESIYDPQPGVFEIAPEVGQLERDLARALADTLRPHTTTHDRCFFGVWCGFGGLRDDVRSAPTFVTPGREYHLMTGPIEAAAERVEVPPTRRSPNLWWPADRAWCVATEIDLNSTYVGCSNACREDLLALDVEAFEIDPATGLTSRSDLRNDAAK